MEYRKTGFNKRLSDDEKIAALNKYLDERRKLLTPEMMKERLIKVGMLDENGNPAAWLSDPDLWVRKQDYFKY